jgi:hypothetical protein
MIEGTWILVSWILQPMEEGNHVDEQASPEWHVPVQGKWRVMGTCKGYPFHCLINILEKPVMCQTIQHIMMYFHG